MSTPALVQVLTPPTATRLTTLERVTAELGTAASGQTTVLTDLLDDASAAVADYCDRIWGQAQYLETLAGTRGQTLVLSRTPLIEIESVLEDTVALTDYTLASPGAGTLYRLGGWGSGGGWDAAAYSSGYIWGGRAPLRYAVQYWAGYLLPEEDLDTGSGAERLPRAVERATIETIKAWFLARAGRDLALVSQQVGDVRETYAAAATLGQLTLPPVAQGLLAQWRRAPFQ